MEVKKDALEKYIKENPNATQLEIAVYFGVSTTTINKKIAEYRIEYSPKTGKKTKVKEEDIQKYLRDFPNATIRDVARAFRVSNATISRILRITSLESGKKILRGPAISKQDIIDYLTLNPKATRIQMASDLQMSMSVLNMHLKKYDIEWNEKEKKFIAKGEYKKEEIEEIPDEEEEVVLYRVKKDDVEDCIRKHPKATIREIAGYLATTEEKLEKYMRNKGIDFEKIQEESKKRGKKQQESKEKFIDKVIALLKENPKSTPEKIRQKLIQRYGRDLPVRRLLELKRLELIRDGKVSEAKEIWGFLIRGTDQALIEQMVEEITQGEDDDGGRD